jgi:DNA repair protein RecO (recombination protein O)
MGVELQPAYILHTRNYRDTSLLVEFITPDFGRVSGVVRGVRSSGKAARQKRGLMQPFIPLLISWTGKTDLKTIIHYEPRATSVQLEGKRLFSALYVNELSMRLVHHYDENAAVFSLYEWVLKSLASDPLIDVSLRRFELSLLECLGYGLPLGESGNKIVAEKLYLFDAAHSDFKESKEERYAGAVNGFKGEELIAIASGEFTPPIRKVAKRLCRIALRSHLGDKPLKSRELFS